MADVHRKRSRVTLLAAAIGIGLALFPKQALAEDWLLVPGASMGFQFLGQRSFSIGPDLVVRHQERRRAYNVGVGAFLMPQIVVPFDGSGTQFSVASGVDVIGLFGSARAGAALRTGSGPTTLSGGAYFAGGLTYAGAQVIPFFVLEGFAPFLGGDSKHPFSLGVRLGIQVPVPNYEPAFSEIAYGRPLRDPRGKVVVAPLDRKAERVVSLDRAAAAGYWLNAARHEHAAIAAFSRLAVDLMSVGAPLRLVRRAQEAALDEVDHTETCLAIARRLGGNTQSGAFGAIARESVARPAPSLAALALESFEDGYVNEGASAACLRVGARHARGSKLRLELATLARDEARHARLGWDIVVFALRSGDPEVRAALEAHLAAPFAVAPGARASRSPLEAHGVLSSSDRARVAMSVARRARTRLAALLASLSSGSCTPRRDTAAQRA